MIDNIMVWKLLLMWLGIVKVNTLFFGETTKEPRLTSEYM